jgi:exonuclease III
MNLLLRNRKTWEFDIIAIQEPWLNSYDEKLTHNTSQGRFRAFVGNSGRPLVCFLLNSKINPTTVRITGRSDHLCSLHITLNTGDGEQTITVHNAYNPHQQGAVYTEGRWQGVPTESVIPELDVALNRYRQNDQVVVGDFNLYHEEWFGETRLPVHGTRKKAQVEALLDIMQSCNMELTLPPGTITRPRSDIRSSLIGTVLDLSWCSDNLAERIDTCRTRPDLDMASDHIPVETVLLINHTPTENKIRKDFRKTDEELFLNTLTPLLPQAINIVTKADLDAAVEQTVSAIQAAAAASTPDRIITLKSVPGFTEDCKEAIQAVKRTQRRWNRVGSTERDLIEFQAAKRQRKKAISAAQRDIHRKKVSEVKDEKGLWALSRWTRNRGSKAPAFTPDIQKPDGTLADNTHEKAHALRQTFFPQPPEADLSDTHYFNYNRPAEAWTPIVEHEVREALRMAPPDKAPGEDDIPNRLLKLATDNLAPILTVLFNKSMDMKYCPLQFKKSITVALRKPGKDDYSQPKSYRPVALMNTIGKVLDTVLARRIQYYAERHKMLPTTHTGGRKQSSCEHAIHLLIEKVHTAWRKRKVASLLMLDVSGAFDNVSHTRLLHNLRKRGLPTEIIDWTASYLTDRKTQIRLYEGLSTEFDVLTGIPQGSPLSPILYLFYNADLLEIASRSSQVVTGYIDDTMFLVEGENTESTVHKLEVLHRKADEWAYKHASVFAPAKYELIHFVYKGDKKKIKECTRPVDLGPTNGVERIIRPKTHARYWGVILDSELNGMKHLDHIRDRVGKSIQALGSIAGSA